MKYLLLLHPELKQDVDRLFVAKQADPASVEAREFDAVMSALAALRDGREDEYEGKRLGYGSWTHDLRDCAELKVAVDELRPDGLVRPSHRLVYREFEPLTMVVAGQVVPDPVALPFRHAVVFGRRADDPAGLTGGRLGRERGMPVQELAGLGGGKPSVGPRLPTAPTTPNRIPIPPDVMKAASLLDAQAAAAAASRMPQESDSPAGTRGVQDRSAHPSQDRDGSL